VALVRGRGGELADVLPADADGVAGQPAGIQPMPAAKMCMAFTLLPTPLLTSGRVMDCTVLPDSSGMVFE
jgi:hypothetical protein